MPPLVILALLGAICGASLPSQACTEVPAGSDHSPGQTTVVMAIAEGPVLRAADGRRLRFEALRFGFGAARMPEPGSQAKKLAAALAPLVGAGLRLHAGPRPVDRYGDLVVQVADAEGCWLQWRLVQQGLAVVDPPPGGTPFDRALLVAEAHARAARLGLWARAAVILADDDKALAAAIGRFVLVEGRVTGITRLRTRTVANFGADWRSDFTLGVAGDDRLVVELSSRTPPGRKVRARGLLRRWAGPYLDIAADSQIEDVPEADASVAGSWRPARN